MPVDYTVLNQLERIAGEVEEKAGVDTPEQQSDPTVEAKLRRIANALAGFVSSIETHSLPQHNDVLSVTSPSTAGQYLRANGSAWVSAGIQLADLPAITLPDLGDVDDALAYGASQILYYDLAKGFTNISPSTWSNTYTYLSNHADVFISSPLDKNLLRYSSGASSWLNLPITSALNNELALANLSDVDDGLGPSNGDLWQFQLGAGWVNVGKVNALNNILSLQHMLDVLDGMSPSDKDLLSYNNASSLWLNLPIVSALNNGLALANLSDVTDGLSPVTAGRLQYGGAEWESVDPQHGQISLVLDGSGLEIGTTGIVATLRVPYNCTVTGWDIVSPKESGSCKIDVYYDTYANYPPTIADVITGSETPQLTTAQKAQDTSLTTWTTTNLAEGAYLAFDIISVDTTTRVELYLYVEERF